MTVSLGIFTNACSVEPLLLWKIIRMIGWQWASRSNSTGLRCHTKLLAEDAKAERRYEGLPRLFRPVFVPIKYRLHSVFSEMLLSTSISFPFITVIYYQASANIKITHLCMHKKLFAYRVKTMINISYLHSSLMVLHKPNQAILILCR